MARPSQLRQEMQVIEQMLQENESNVQDRLPNQNLISRSKQARSSQVLFIKDNEINESIREKQIQELRLLNDQNQPGIF